MLKGASPRPRPQTSSVAGPLLVGRGDLGIGKNVEEDRSYLVALVSVEGGSPFEDLERLSYFPLLVAGLTHKDSHIFKRDTMSRLFYMFKNS